MKEMNVTDVYEINHISTAEMKSYIRIVIFILGAGCKPRLGSGVWYIVLRI